MTLNLVPLFTFGLLDAINPATIGTVLILLPLVKKKWHTQIFIWSTFAYYLVAGIIIYTGVSCFLSDYVKQLVLENKTIIYYLELLLSFILFLFAIYLVIKLCYRKYKGLPRNDYMSVVIKMINPLSLVFLAITTMSLEIPTAFPYIGFLGFVNSKHPNFCVELVQISLYCIIYISPLLFLDFIFGRFDSKKYEIFVSRFKMFVNIITEYIVILLLILSSIWLLYDGLTL